MQFLTQGWGIARPLGPFINGQLGTKAVVLSCSLGVEPEMKKAKGRLFTGAHWREGQYNAQLPLTESGIYWGNNTEYSLFIANTSVDHSDRLYPKLNGVTLR